MICRLLPPSATPKGLNMRPSHYCHATIHPSLPCHNGGAVRRMDYSRGEDSCDTIQYPDSTVRARQPYRPWNPFFFSPLLFLAGRHGAPWWVHTARPASTISRGGGESYRSAD